jgi:hypothetical protein
VNALEFQVEGLLVTLACFGLSVAQRALSTPVRELRRRTQSVSGVQRLHDGRTIELSAERIAAPLDRALFATAIALMLLAAAVTLVRV